MLIYVFLKHCFLPVESLRLVLNPFGEYLDCSSKDTALADLGVLVGILQSLTGTIRVRMAIGPL